MNAMTSLKFIIKKSVIRGEKTHKAQFKQEPWAQKPAPDTEKETVTNETSSIRKNRVSNSVGNT